MNGITATLVAALAALLLLSSSDAHAQAGCGDPDADGFITDTDGVNVLRAAASLSSSCTLATCDVNADGVINDVDGVNVLRAAALLDATIACTGAAINDFVSEVQNEDGPPGSLRVGAAPIPGQGAPDTIGDIEGNTTVVAGGSNTVDIPYDASAQAGAAQAAQAGELFLVIAIADLAGVFVDGFYTIPLSAIAGVVRVTIVFPQSLGEGSFLLCPATEFAGALSQYGALQQDPADAGGGVLQVSLSFSPSQDLDLHVVEPAPNGEEIFFGRRTSAAGGMLDLDSNPGCSIDNINNENVTYPEGSNPIQGMYVVRVRMFARCVAGTTPFTIVLNNAGLTSSINGSFNAEEGAGAMREFMFTHPPSA